MKTPKPKHLVLLGTSFAIWAGGFVVIYAALTVGCAWNWESIRFGPISLLQAFLLVLATAVLAVALFVNLQLSNRYIAVWDKNKTSDFITTTTRCLSIASIFAIIFTFSGIFALSICN